MHGVFSFHFDDLKHNSFPMHCQEEIQPIFQNIFAPEIYILYKKIPRRGKAVSAARGLADVRDKRDGALS